MSSSQFDQDEALLLPDAYKALCDHFSNIETFEAEYKQIIDPIKKIRFLRLASAYRNLIKEGRFSVPSDALPMSGFNYYETTYKFVAIVAIIEAVVGDVEWIDFYEWLNREKRYVILDKYELANLYSQYKSEHGATKNMVRFFQSLDKEEQAFLKSKIVLFQEDKGRMIEKESSIRDIAVQLYDIRSQFMHNAMLFVGLGEIPLLMSKKKKRKRELVASTLSLNQLMKVFERGFIRYFGLRAERNILLF